MEWYDYIGLEDLEGEEWRKVPGIPHIYEVSNFGRVKSVKNKIIRKQGLSNSGYVCVVLWIEGKYKNVFTHRLVAKAFLPNPQNKPTINHIDGNKTNNKIINLEWATYSENEKHSYRAGLKSHKGEKNGMSSLNEEKVREIRKYRNKYKSRSGIVKILAKIYGVSETTIRYVIRGDSWKNV